MEISLQQVKSAWEGRKSSKLTTAQIVQSIKDQDPVAAQVDDDTLKKQVAKILTAGCKNGQFSKKPNERSYRLKRQTVSPLIKSLPSVAKKEGLTTNTNFIGRAGELVVMSELVIRDYNISNMEVDEGIDIVAMKNNTLYYVQVKSTLLKDGHEAVVSIKNTSFENNIQNYIRYVVAVRCGTNDWRFFTFNQALIKDMVATNVIKKGKDAISLTIWFNPDDKKPYLKTKTAQKDILEYMNNFDL